MQFQQVNSELRRTVQAMLGQPGDFRRERLAATGERTEFRSVYDWAVLIRNDRLAIVLDGFRS